MGSVCSNSKEAGHLWGDSAIYARLSDLGIHYDYYEHGPAPTIAQAMEYWRDIPAWHCKNLFLRNHKGNRHYLVLVEGHSDVDIRSLELLLGQGKLSFASAHRLAQYLQTQAGSVSPLGLIHDVQHHVYVFIDERFREADRIAFHPNDNRASLVIARSDLERYISAQGNRWEYRTLATKV